MRAGGPGRIRRDESALGEHTYRGCCPSQRPLPRFLECVGQKNEPADDLEAILENVEECAGICARLEGLLGLAGRAKLVGNDGAEAEGVEIWVDLLPEDVLGLRRIT